MRGTLALLVLSSVLVVGIATAASPVGRGRLPEAIPLTSAATAGTGFHAEGIESSGRFAYAGSLATGTIVRVDLLTEAVTTLVESAGGPAVGLELPIAACCSSPEVSVGSCAPTTRSRATSWQRCSSPRRTRRSSTTSR